MEGYCLLNLLLSKRVAIIHPRYYAICLLNFADSARLLLLEIEKASQQPEKTIVETDTAERKVLSQYPFPSRPFKF